MFGFFVLLLGDCVGGGFVHFLCCGFFGMVLRLWSFDFLRVDLFYFLGCCVFFLCLCVFCVGVFFFGLWLCGVVLVLFGCLLWIA